MRTSHFDFDLPEDRVALRPVEPRDSARLLVVREGTLDDRIVTDLPDLLQPGDALVFNDTRVIPARLSGNRTRSGPDGEALSVAPSSRSRPTTRPTIACTVSGARCRKRRRPH